MLPLWGNKADNAGLNRESTSGLLFLKQQTKYDKKKGKMKMNFAAARIEPGTSCVRDGSEDH